MKWRYYILATAVAFVLIVLAWLVLRERQAKADVQPAPTPSANAVKHDSRLPVHTTQATMPFNPIIVEQSRDKVIEDYFSQPIDLYAKVVDETGAPISSAETQYSVYSEWLKPNQRPVTGPRSDPSGMFAITGRKGSSIFVRVTHPDFYETEQSKGNFSHTDSGGFSSSASQPVIFVLQKKGVAEPLVNLRQVKPVPKNGAEAKMNIGEDGSRLVVQAWTSPPNPGAVNGVPFAWKCRVSVPGGGLIPYNDEYRFTAPEKGYAPSADFEMPEAGRDGKWRDRFEQLYFLKFANGRYARIRLQMIADGGHFAVVESYYNPSGSRNLEYNPSKTISSN
jgi:hypothetical protein